MKDLIVRNILSGLAKELYRKDYFLLERELSKVKLNIEIHPETKKRLKKLLIRAEDKRHFSHIGFDSIAIARALRNYLLFQKKEGASTIDQQLVRVITNNYEKTLRRKLKEILLATTLPDLVRKEEIWFIYLLKAYYGTGMENFTQASQKMKIDIRRVISYSEAAGLVARIKYPEPVSFSKIKIDKINIRINYLLDLIGVQ